MRFLTVKTGGRKFWCVDCDGDPLRSSDVKKLLKGELDRRIGSR
jgi:hypothetical protein